MITFSAVFQVKNANTLAKLRRKEFLTIIVLAPVEISLQIFEASNCLPVDPLLFCHADSFADIPSADNCSTDIITNQVCQVFKSSFILCTA
jgi:hypothetical protein